MGKIAFFFFVAILFLGDAQAASLHPEKYYQEKWCNEHKGKTEVVLTNNTRADCITDSNVIEFDFGKKWAESIGQALNYSEQTGKRAGIVLIMEDASESKYLLRVKDIIKHFRLPIDVWGIGKL